MATIQGKYGSADILSGKHDLIIVPVNAMGITGAGLAKAVATRFPAFRLWYIDQCAERILAQSGDFAVFRQPNGSNDPLIVALVTKKFPHNLSNLGFLETFPQVCRDIVSLFDASEQPISIGIPALGCGLGGLKWRSVSQILISRVSQLPEKFTVTLYGPHIGV